MKLHGNVYDVNKQSLEEGLIKDETTDGDFNFTGARKSNHWNRCLQLVKVILYLELILFIGWTGCVFITNYYQVHNHNDLDVPYGASEWSQSPDSLDSTMDSNSISSDVNKLSPVQDDTKPITVNSQMHTESVNKKKNVISEMEVTTATNVIDPDDTEVELLLFSRYLESLAIPKNTWDDSSSKSTSIEDTFGWFRQDRSSSTKSVFNANTDAVSSTENHFGTQDKDDEIDLSYHLTLPLWHNVLANSDYLDDKVNSNKDSFEEDKIANARLLFENRDIKEHHWSRQARSTIGQEEDNSSTSSREESTTNRGESNTLNSQASDEDQCPTILDDEGNVIKEAKDVINYISKNWVRWFKETYFPKCDKPKIAKSVTVDKCGKFVVNCEVDEKKNTPMKHHRYTRNVEGDIAAKENCERLVTAMPQAFDAWRAKLITGESSDPIVRNLHQEIGKHVLALVVKEIVERMTGRQPKTNEEWQNSVITMKENISELKDAKDRNSLTNNSELTLEMGADLGKIVETAVNIYMNCRNLSLAPLEAQVITMMVEREMCLQGLERITTIENNFAAEIVPGESTNSNVTMLRRRFMTNVMALIIRMIVDERHGFSMVPPTGPVNVTHEQWTSNMLRLKKNMTQYPEYPALRQQLEDAFSPTQDHINQLREIAEYYMRQSIQCSMLKLFELMGEFRDVGSNNIRSADSKWEPSYIKTYKFHRGENNLRGKRAVVADLVQTSSIVTCTLEDDAIQFQQERQERLDRYNQFVALSTVDVREPFVNAIEEKLNGTSPASNSDEKPTPIYMRYMNAVDVFVGNSSSSLQNEGYRLLRDIVLEIKYLDDNETAFEGYDMDTLMQNWTSCLIHIPDNYTAETILMAVIKAGEAINLHYSGAEEGKNCGDEFTPVYGTFTYVGEEPEKSIVRRWRHIFREIVTLYFRMNNPEVLPQLHCTNNKDESQTKKSNVGGTVIRLGKRAIEYPIRKLGK